ncbi:MAG: hypothetical protein Ct9H90mP5_11290 [Acidimicrobiaceae bacterium]|nr:MAG: hypothetical protein Ct9H90mP5_11290 [Acidimicrobiaceae bacterium]
MESRWDSLGIWKFSPNGSAEMLLASRIERYEVFVSRRKRKGIKYPSSSLTAPSAGTKEGSPGK